VDQIDLFKEIFGGTKMAESDKEFLDRVNRVGIMAVPSAEIKKIHQIANTCYDGMTELKRRIEEKDKEIAALKAQIAEGKAAAKPAK